MSSKDLVGCLLLCVMVVGVAWAPVSCTKMNNEKIESAIKVGIDPVIAQCTYSATPDRVACAMASASKNK